MHLTLPTQVILSRLRALALDQHRPEILFGCVCVPGPCSSHLAGGSFCICFGCSMVNGRSSNNHLLGVHICHNYDMFHQTSDCLDPCLSSSTACRRLRLSLCFCLCVCLWSERRHCQHLPWVPLHAFGGVPDSREPSTQLHCIRRRQVPLRRPRRSSCCDDQPCFLCLEGRTRRPHLDSLWCQDRTHQISTSHTSKTFV